MSSPFLRFGFHMNIGLPADGKEKGTFYFSVVPRGVVQQAGWRLASPHTRRCGTEKLNVPFSGAGWRLGPRLKRGHSSFPPGRRICAGRFTFFFQNRLAALDGRKTESPLFRRPVSPDSRPIIGYETGRNNLEMVRGGYEEQSVGCATRLRVAHGIFAVAVAGQ